MLGAPSIVPDVDLFLCLPRVHPYYLLGGLKYRRGLGWCQDLAASRPLVVAGRPSNPWEDFNYKCSPCGLLVVTHTAVDRGW